MAKTELKILIGLHRAINYIDRQSTKIFSEYQLTLGQFAVLEALHHKGDMTVGQVQEKILSSGGTMPLIINNLEKIESPIEFKGVGVQFDFDPMNGY